MKYWLIALCLTLPAEHISHGSDRPSTVKDTIVHIAQKYRIDPKIMLKMAHVESTMRPYKINKNDHGSPSYGLFQIKLLTAKQYCGIIKHKELMGSYNNADCAAQILKAKIAKYGLEKGIAAYNAGKPKYKNGKLINRRYVQKVLGR